MNVHISIDSSLKINLQHAKGRKCWTKEISPKYFGKQARLPQRGSSAKLPIFRHPISRLIVPYMSRHHDEHETSIHPAAFNTRKTDPKIQSIAHANQKEKNKQQKDKSLTY